MRGAVQMQVTAIGLDIAKNVFQVHGIDAAEKVVVRKQLRRSQVMAFFEALPPCLIGMEACATAHYWARELTKLGHEVRLMPAKDVKAYAERQLWNISLLSGSLRLDAQGVNNLGPFLGFAGNEPAEIGGRVGEHGAADVLEPCLHRGTGKRHVS